MIPYLGISLLDKYAASFSILLNGMPKGFSKSSQGLRQGDTLTRMIFSLVVIANPKIVAAQTQYMLKGFKVKVGGTDISTLQYADNTLVFFKITL